MSTPLNPREIYLLERYCQPAYFEKVRDAWAEAVGHAENMLCRFMGQLPADCRNRPLPYQPDRVWGERVLPNFRNTLQGLNDSYISLAQGDLAALDSAAGVASDLRGQRMDYPETWMEEVEPGAAAKFTAMARAAEVLADPIVCTIRRFWSEGNLTTNYSKYVKAPLNPPPSWPVYSLSQNVRMRSGERTPKTGIYLPDVDRSCPALMIATSGLAGKAAEAEVPSVFLPDGSQRYRSPATWTLVERVADTGGGVPEDNDHPQEVSTAVFAMTGASCPRSSVWSPRADVPIPDEHIKGNYMPMAELRDRDGTLQQRATKWQLVKATD